MTLTETKNLSFNLINTAGCPCQKKNNIIIPLCFPQPTWTRWQGKIMHIKLTAVKKQQVSDPLTRCVKRTLRMPMCTICIIIEQERALWM